MAKLGDLAVGSLVNLNETGVAASYMVVHQGLPSADYDSSCNGTWLLRRDHCSNQMSYGSTTDYASSKIHTWFNDTFFNKLDEHIRDAIFNVKIPYQSGSTVMTGSNGLQTKIFAPSVTEVGKKPNSMLKCNVIGAAWEYFASDNTLINNYTSTRNWWSRSPSTEEAGYICCANTTATINSATVRVLPAMVIDPKMSVDKNGFVTKASIAGQATIGATGKEISGGYCNVGGVWKEVSEAYVNVNGVWKPAF